MKFIDISLCQIYDNKISKLNARNSTICNCLINKKIQIYNGKFFRNIDILDIHVGHKLGELVFSRTNCEHLHKKKRQILKSKNLKKNVKI